MATSTVPEVQLATRIPKVLHTDIKKTCVNEECSIMAFVIEALTLHLAKVKAKGKK
jgi:predicted HicB family RNase H-like nuclease